MITTLRWIRATSLGCLLGIPFVVLLALAGEMLGVGGSQVLVGLGMGAGVGVLQGRAIRLLLGAWRPWTFATAVGLAIPFLVGDLMRLSGREFAYSLQWSLVAGGVIVGIWQALLLRARVQGVAWWVVGSVVGWALAGGAAWLADLPRATGQLRGLVGALVFIGLIGLAGAVLGLVTGAVLARSQRAVAAP